MRRMAACLAITMLCAGAVFCGHPAGAQPAPPVPAPSPRDSLVAPVVPDSFATDTLDAGELREASANLGGNGVQAVRGRYELRNEYVNERGSAQSRTTTARIDYPLSPTTVLRLNLPLGYYDPNDAAGSPKVSGVGDVAIRIRKMALNNPDFGAGFDVDFILPTASETDLGKGKVQIVPGMLFTMAQPRIGSVTTLQILQYYSAWGNPDRKDINYSRYRLTIDTPWNPRFWTALEPFVFVDYIGGNIGSVVEAEAGYKLDRNVRMWVRLGKGIGGPTPGRYDAMAQIGLRYLWDRADLMAAARSQRKAAAGDAAARTQHR